jgi:hypothetical protein
MGKMREGELIKSMMLSFSLTVSVVQTMAMGLLNTM